MANLKNVVYLKQSQYETLVLQGYLDVGEFHLDYDENSIYVTDSETEKTAKVVKSVTQEWFDTNPHDTSTFYLITDATYYIDIGSLQVALDDKVYPKIKVGDAKKIVNKYKEDGSVTIKWSVLNVATYFSPIYFTEASNQFVVFLHGRLIKYQWLVDAGDDIEITPEYADEQRYIHTVNVDHSTGSGTWKYQFQFKDEDATHYQWLYDVAAHVYEEYRTNGNVATLPASGTYRANGGTVYIVTGLKPANTTQVEVLLLNIADGEESSITTGAVPVTDWVH